MSAELSRLVPGAKRLLVAVSGGADSVALLRLLHGSGYRLEVAHFDHGLRLASAEDAEFVRALCADLGVPFHLERAEVARIAEEKGWNLEDAARRMRYAFFNRVAKRVRADALVTAHTLDDQAETVLLQLLRGAAYLTGMPERQRRVVRPLLGVAKGELLEYLAALDQDYRHDETNRDTRRARAWLRHDIFPKLEKRFPGVKRGLARHGVLQQDMAAHFDALAAPYLESGVVNARALAREDAALQRQVLAKLLEAQGLPVTLERLERLREHLADAAPFRLTLSGETTARIAYGRLELVRGQAEALPALSIHDARQLPQSVSETVLALPDLVYRSRRAGDVIHLSAGRKKLSDLFTDLKVPREERDGIRLLASGSRVVWAEGLALDPSYAIGALDPDFALMKLALEQANLAFAAGELPVGALVVRNGQIIASAHNRTEALSDPSAHAEVLALREATRVLGDWRLPGCTLYVTLEPCPMCFGAMLQAHLPRLVYGADNRREGAIGSVVDLSKLRWKRKLEVKGGVLAGASAKLLRAFFAERRAGAPLEP